MENLRETKFYQELTTYQAVEIAEGFGGGEGTTEEELLTAWQKLHDTKLAYQLQGWFGRTASSLIEQNLIQE
jgi:hypothetical protein